MRVVRGRRILGRDSLTSSGARLEATLEFAAFASRPMPLLSLLDEAPRRIATILYSAKECRECAHPQCIAIRRIREEIAK